MPSIVGKRRGAQTYYYLVSSARVGGKPRIVEQQYLGTAEEVMARLTGAAQGAPARTQQRHSATSPRCGQPWNGLGWRPRSTPPAGRGGRMRPPR